MKKYYILLLFITSWVNAQIVNIPDANFKNFLVSASPLNGIAKDELGNSITIDINGDNEIQISEAILVYELRIYGITVIQLIGIEDFINLSILDCSNTSITTLDLTSLINLTDFKCNSTPLNNLNITGLINLEKLNLYGNQLSSLDISNLSSLYYFTCSNNLMTNINLEGATSLYQLSCSNNLISNLDLDGLQNLTILYCYNNLLSSLSLDSLSNLNNVLSYNNQLTSLEIINCPELVSVDFKNNLLSNISFSDNLPLKSLTIDNNNFSDISFILNLDSLETIYCSNNPILNLDFVGLIPTLEWLQCSNTLISTLDLSNNHNFTVLQAANNPNLVSLFLKFGRWNLTIQDGYHLSNNPNLQYVCVDDFRVDTFTNYFANQNMDNVVVNSYCSFTPGGDHNTITGSILFDSNNNGCDATDLPQPNIKININDGTNQGATFTSNSGNYSFFTQTGNFNLTPNVENPSWFNFSPTYATIPFVNNNNNVVAQNFCITANGVHPDLEIVIVPIIPARPGFDAVYKIVYKNKGNQTVSGVVNFTYNDAVLDFLSASVIPTNSGSGFMNWTISNVAPFQVGTFLVTFNVNSPQEIPAVNNGDVLSFNATVTLPSDDNLADNSFDFNQIVVGSYDPNDITCLQGNALPTTEIGSYLHYNIRFENTGTAAAENIVVASEIDLSQYNIESLQVMESSHPVEIRVTGNMIEFIHQNINLDSGGHGNILLKLKSNATLSDDLVINSANIFFDYNFPIETNDEQTVFADLSKNDFVKDVSIQVYPNPSTSIINIKADNSIKAIQLYDVQGRLLFTKTANENTQILDVSNYSSGIYFVNVSTTMGKLTQKIIKN